jgi:hypothetical protein
VEWTKEAILARLRELPRCPGVVDADLQGHAEDIFFAGSWAESEKPKVAAVALGKAHTAVAALGPRARQALTRAIGELRPDPWHHPVDGYMPVPPSPWDPQYQRLLDANLLLEAFSRAEAEQRGYVARGRPQRLSSNLLAAAIVRAWHRIVGACPPSDLYEDQDAVRPFHQLAFDLFKSAKRQDSWQSPIRIAIRELRHDKN